MDILEFSRKYRRMCLAFEACTDGCPAKYISCGDISEITQELVDIVEKWNEEHPAKTHQTEFLEHYPNAEIDSEGTLSIQPCCMQSGLRDACGDTNCYQCRQEYWAQEV